jgi:surface antigen
VSIDKPPRALGPVTTNPSTAELPPLPCREGTYSAMIDGRPQTIRAHLCQNADGTWTAKPK